MRRAAGEASNRNEGDRVGWRITEKELRGKEGRTAKKMTMEGGEENGRSNEGT